MAETLSPEEAVSFVKQVRNLLAINPSNSAMGQHRLNLLDSMRLIPTYSGEENSLSLDKFWDIFQSNAKYFNWEEEDKLFALKHRLSGKALALVEVHQQPDSKVEDIIKILKERFAVKKVEGEILADFFAFKQPDYLSVEDYIAEAKKRVKEVSKALGITQDKKEETEDRWVRNMLLKNLNDNIRRGVISRNPLTLKELEAVAKSEEIAWLATKPVGSVSVGTTNLNPFAPEFTAVAEIKKNHKENEVDQLKEMVKNLALTVENMSSQVQQLSQLKFEEGNKISECARPQPNAHAANVACFNCGRLGHFKRACPVLGQKTQPSGVDATMPYQNYQNYYRGGFGAGNYIRGQQPTLFHMGNSRNFNPNRGGFQNNRNQYQNRGRSGNARGFNNRGRTYRNADYRENIQLTESGAVNVAETSSKNLNE